MPATMALWILVSLTQLTTIMWTKLGHKLWSSAAEFQKRNTDFNFELTADMGQAALAKIDERVRGNPN